MIRAQTKFAFWLGATMRFKAVLFSGLLLAACATPYRPPSGTPPQVWTGAAGLAPAPGVTAKLNETTLDKNGVIATLDVDHIRTGRIRDELRFRSAYGGEMVIAAGAPARAEQLTMFVSSTYNPTPVVVGAGNNPIEWCAQQVNGETVCIFWESPDRARYISTYTQTAPRLVLPYSAAGMVGPMPVIEEVEIDLGPPLQQRLVVRDWDRRGVDVWIQILQDGTVGRGDRLRFAWNDLVFVRSMGISFRLEPMGPADRPTGVQVRGITPQ